MSTRTQIWVKCLHVRKSTAMKSNKTLQIIKPSNFLVNIYNLSLTGLNNVGLDEKVLATVVAIQF